MAAGVAVETCDGRPAAALIRGGYTSQLPCVGGKVIYEHIRLCLSKLDGRTWHWHGTRHTFSYISSRKR